MAERLQKAAEYRRLLKPLFPPTKRLMLCLIFGSCILPQTPVGLVGCSRCPMGGNQSSERPQAQIQKLWVRLCCCYGFHHLSTAWVHAVGTPWAASASPFEPTHPWFSQMLPRGTKPSDVPWAISTPWIALWCSSDKGSVQPKVFCK